MIKAEQVNQKTAILNNGSFTVLMSEEGSVRHLAIADMSSAMRLERSSLSATRSLSKTTISLLRS